MVTPAEDFLDRYEELKNTALQYLEAGALGKADIETLCSRVPTLLIGIRFLFTKVKIGLATK